MKILFIQLRKMGDVLTTTPAIRQIRQQFPDATIDFVSEERGAEVYKYNPCVDNVHMLKRKIPFREYVCFLLKIRRERYNIVFDLFGNPKSSQITLFSGAKQRIGFKTYMWSYVYKKRVNLREEFDNFEKVYAPICKLRLFKFLFKVNEEDSKIEFYISDTERNFAKSYAKKYGINKEKTIAMCVVCERDYGRVPIRYYKCIVDYLIEKGHTIYLVYGPGEREATNELYDLIEDKEKLIIDYEMTTILQSRAVLEHCKAYIGNDCGNKHLAITAGIPTFALFYRDNKDCWTPPNDDKHWAEDILEDEKMVSEKEINKKIRKFHEVNII